MTFGTETRDGLLSFVRFDKLVNLRTISLCADFLSAKSCLHDWLNFGNSHLTFTVIIRTNLLEIVHIHYFAFVFTSFFYSWPFFRKQVYPKGPEGRAFLSIWNNLNVSKSLLVQTWQRVDNYLSGLYLSFRGVLILEYQCENKSSDSHCQCSDCNEYMEEPKAKEEAPEAFITS